MLNFYLFTLSIFIVVGLLCVTELLLGVFCISNNHFSLGLSFK